MNAFTTRTSWRSWRTIRHLLRLLPAAGILVLATGLLCGGDHEITWVNQTSVALDIYEGEGQDDFALEIEPHSTRKVTHAEELWEDVVLVRDKRGNELLREEITWDQLKAQDYLFVITQEMLAPAPAATP